LLDRIEPYASLADAALERHRDVLSVEATQADTLLALLQPSAQALEALPESAHESQVLRPGWSFDTLTPYLLRDWTNSSELQVTSSRIGAALERACPDPRGKRVAFAGCGAGGLLAKISTDFGRVLAFDLTLPILAAARHILDGKTLELALPRIWHESGRISLGAHGGRSGHSPVELFAMDALETAFADRSIDCIVTVFLTDILPDPRALADEVHRILSDDGVWINYGPSGNNLKGLWRFDQREGATFFEAAGFGVMHAEASRSTNLDVSDVCPSMSFRNTVCYLTLARKCGQPEARASVRSPDPAEIREVVPRHFPGARLVHQLQTAEKGGMAFQHDRVPGRVHNWQLGDRAARIMLLVDGSRTVGEIAGLLERRVPPQPIDATLRAFARFFAQGLLTWRGPEP
jgi:SAM-dependent methyltransferase